jgi:hypothetical protein
VAWKLIQAVVAERAYLLAEYPILFYGSDEDEGSSVQLKYWLFPWQLEY